MKNSIFISLIMGSLFLLSAAFTSWQPNPWAVPDNFQKLKNPVASDDSSVNIGKELYGKHCRSCHGKEGLGDGPKAAQLDTPSGDFTTEDFTSQSDGSIFYKTREGRDDMPSFKKKIPNEEDIWHIVNFIRTLE
jgi:mono/diheme cytochrome c family protein